jgi:uncharacterized membrane protein
MNGQRFPRGGDFAVHVGRGDGWPGSLEWVIFGLLLALLLIAIVSLVLDAYYRSQRPKRWMRMFPPDMPPGDRALAVLDMRYARGELSRDEYVQARDDLGGAAEATTEVASPAPRRRRMTRRTQS